MYNMLDFSIGSYKIKGEYVLIPIILWIAFGHLLCGCSKVSAMEGFDMIGAKYSLGHYNPINTNKWMQTDLQTKAGAVSLMARKEQPVPLPEGELDIFATTPFKPECCPNTYSNSSGCACITTKQYDYLIKRGGNNVPYSEY